MCFGINCPESILIEKKLLANLKTKHKNGILVILVPIYLGIILPEEICNKLLNGGLPLYQCYSVNTFTNTIHRISIIHLKLYSSCIDTSLIYPNSILINKILKNLFLQIKKKPHIKLLPINFIIHGKYRTNFLYLGRCEPKKFENHCTILYMHFYIIVKYT